ncbi:MAG: hypothetical protein DHS80DRAFT_32106 [Piptocephalis tieghemiana]|nr:MAG: hypothetical protein DHS80DRAFT_32106 [Piptocephalis tieghemiana]
MATGKKKKSKAGGKAPVQVHTKTKTRALPRPATVSSAKESKGRKSKVGGDRRPVFRPVFDSPYRCLWPSIPSTKGAEWSSKLCSSIASIGIRHRKIRKQCAQAHVKSTPSSSPDGSKKRKLSETDTIKTNKDLPQTPLVLKHLSIGMSSVVRALRQARSGLEEESGPRPILVVFCCKADVSPAHLIDHLPALARQAEVRIITLPKGSEESLSRALGCSRVSVIAIKASLLQEDSKDIDVEDKDIMSLKDLCADDDADQI